MADRPESRQPPPPPPDAAPPEQRTPDVCRNYVWGTCRKYSQCRFRHELNFAEMKTILKFCHDHQNMETCPRKGCTYLHTSKEEEKLFLEKGTIPRDLAERHAAMAAAAATSSRRVLPAASSGRGCAVPPPPPPTPAPPPPPPAAMPPPPPPLPPPTTYAEGYSYGPVPHHAYSAPPIPGFDASRPPPPFKSIADKRKSSSPFEAPARKTAKGPTLGNCHECAHLETRIGESKQLIQKIINEEADRSLLLKKKLEDYRTRKQLLLALVPPDKAREVDAFIEGTPIVQQDTHTQWANQLSHTTSRIAGNTSVPHQILVVLGTNTLPGSEVGLREPKGTDVPAARSYLMSVSTARPRRQIEMKITSIESQFQNMDESTLIQSLRRSLAQQTAGQEDMSSLLSTVASVITTNTSSTEVVQGVVNYGARAPLEATNGYAQRPMLPRQYPAFHPSMPPPSAYSSPPAAYPPPPYNHLPPRPDSSMMAALPRSPMEVPNGYPPPAAFPPPPYTNSPYPAVTPPSTSRPAPPLPAAAKNYTNQYTFGVCQNMSSYHYTTYQ